MKVVYDTLPGTVPGSWHEQITWYHGTASNFMAKTCCNRSIYPSKGNRQHTHLPVLVLYASCRARQQHQPYISFFSKNAPWLVLVLAITTIRGIFTTKQTADENPVVGKSQKSRLQQSTNMLVVCKERKKERKTGKKAFAPKDTYLTKLLVFYTSDDNMSI